MSRPWDPSEARQKMIRDLSRHGVTDAATVAAMERIPRECFVPPELASRAYSDCALPIECDQTISQPAIVALMTQALRLTGREQVLEIGTGSGYQTAILAQLAARVVTVERHPHLNESAQEALESLGIDNVTFVTGDGALGYPPLAPYDGILVACAAAHIPLPLWEQLREGGRIVIPLGGADAQVLEAVEKRAGQPVAEHITHCRFVPFVGADE